MQSPLPLGVFNGERIVATLLKRFSERLYFLRTQRELTQEALAHGAKLHPGYISALERSTKMQRWTL